MRENKVKRSLAAGGTAFGTMVFEFSTTGIGRATAEAGADFLIFDQEHNGWSVETIRMLIATTRSADLAPFVRVPATQYHLNEIERLQAENQDLESQLRLLQQQNLQQRLLALAQPAQPRPQPEPPRTPPDTPTPLED